MPPARSGQDNKNPCAPASRQAGQEQAALLVPDSIVVSMEKGPPSSSEFSVASGGAELSNENEGGPHDGQTTTCIHC